MTSSTTATTRRSRRASSEEAPLAELNAPAASATPSDAPSASPSPSVATAPSATPSDPLASIAPGGPTLFEYLDGPRPRRWIVRADGVETAWRAWRIAHPVDPVDGFVAAVGHALGDRPEALTAVAVVRVKG